MCHHNFIKLFLLLGSMGGLPADHGRTFKASPSFALTSTVMHSKPSPLFGETRESLLESEAQVLVSLTGIDETVAQMIHARHAYPVHKILRGFWQRSLLRFYPFS
jgi:hypothetical protein